MVKLQRNKVGTYYLSVPREKVEKLGLKVGDRFDVTYDASYNLVYTKLEKTTN